MSLKLLFWLQCPLREGFKKIKKSCNIVTTYVGGRMGNYTKFIYFLHSPNSSKFAKKFFLMGVGGVMVGRYLNSEVGR